MIKTMKGDNIVRTFIVARVFWSRVYVVHVFRLPIENHPNQMTMSSTAMLFVWVSFWEIMM